MSSMVILSPYSVMTDVANILGAHPIFEVKKTTAILNEHQPTIRVRESTEVVGGIRIFVSEELGNLLMSNGYEVIDANAISEGEPEDNDDETEDEAPKKRGRSKKAVEPEPEEEEEPNYYVEYFPTDVSVTLDTLTPLTDTRAWRRAWRKNEEVLSSKMSQYLGQLNGLNTVVDLAPQMEESGMSENPNLTDNAAMFRNLIAAQAAEKERFLTNITTLLGWFEQKVLRIEVDEDTGEAVATVEEVTHAQLDTYLDRGSEKGAELMEKVQFELVNLLITV